VKRHEIDYFSLAAGLLFTILGLGLAISATTGWHFSGAWIAPVTLIVLGGGGVAASLAGSRRSHAAYAAQAAQGQPSDIQVGPGPFPPVS
jgi:hypothetical protein